MPLLELMTQAEDLQWCSFESIDNDD